MNKSNIGWGILLSVASIFGFNFFLEVATTKGGYFNLAPDWINLSIGLILISGIFAINFWYWLGFENE